MADFADELRALIHRTRDQLQHIQTEEATKNALVMPFIRILGYDVFDPLEVVPEFTADVGVKKGEKVDYALMVDGQPAVLIECKTVGTPLEDCHASQLYRYFSVTKARIGVLTNGIVYYFYSDLDESNKMDSRPFLVSDLLSLKDNIVLELKKLSKAQFDVDRIVSAAGALKYTRGVRTALEDELQQPSQEFVKHFAKRVYTGLLTKAVRDEFTPIVQQAFADLIRDRITERLQSALDKEQPAEAETPEPEAEKPDDGVVTTEEELEGYQIVRAIVRERVDAHRITHRDRKTYFAVLLDDNGRKPICRLRFNTSQKYVGLFDAEKNEERVPIEDLSDIFNLADRLKATVGFYEKR